MNQISIDVVKKLATLSSLNLSSQDEEAMKVDLTHIVGYIDQLQDIDVEGIEPTYQTHELETVTRPDTVIDYGVSQENLLKNAPLQRDGYIVVPRVFE